MGNHCTNPVHLFPYEEEIDFFLVMAAITRSFPSHGKIFNRWTQISANNHLVQLREARLGKSLHLRSGVEIKRETRSEPGITLSVVSTA